MSILWTTRSRAVLFSQRVAVEVVPCFIPVDIAVPILTRRWPASTRARPAGRRVGIVPLEVTPGNVVIPSGLVRVLGRRPSAVSRAVATVVVSRTSEAVLTIVARSLVGPSLPVHAQVDPRVAVSALRFGPAAATATGRVDRAGGGVPDVAASFLAQWAVRVVTGVFSEMDVVAVTYCAADAARGDYGGHGCGGWALNVGAKVVVIFGDEG